MRDLDLVKLQNCINRYAIYKFFHLTNPRTRCWKFIACKKKNIFIFCNWKTIGIVPIIIQCQSIAIRQRKVRGQPMGECRKVVFIFLIHRVYCKDCKYRSIENIHFLSHPKIRLTRSLERTILELRQHMSIQAVANFFQLRWHTIKELEKRALKRKYSRKYPTAPRLHGA